MKVLLGVLQILLSIGGCTVLYNYLGAGLLGTPQLEWWQVWAAGVMITAMTLPSLIVMTYKEKVLEPLEQRVFMLIATVVVYAISTVMLGILTWVSTL